MQKVIMVNPNWGKGYIDRLLVVPAHCKYIVPVNKYDPILLSHIQYANVGDYIFRVRHFIKTGTRKENQYLVLSDNDLVTPKNLTITDEIAGHLEELRNPPQLMFSIFKGIDMSIHEMFDCDIASRKKFLTPLKLVDEEMFDFIVDNLQFSRDLDCDINWAGAAKLPRWLNQRERLVIDADGKSLIHTSEHWLLFHENGIVTFPELESTKGAKVDGTTQRTLEVFTAAPHPMPSDVHMAIKITIGANPVGDTMKGISWNLYKRNIS